MNLMTNAPFLPPSWHGLARQIAHLSEFGGSVQVISGPKGAGKTTLLRHLLSVLDSPPLHVSVEPDVPTSQTYLSLLEQAGMYPNSGAALGELLVLLRQFAEGQLKAHTRTVIIIDDAHLFEDAELAALISVLQGHEEAGFGLHLLLFTKPGLTGRIDMMPLVDVSVHDSDIPGLSPLEMRSWLEQSGEKGMTSNWGDGQIQQLWSDTQGRPGAVLSRLQALNAPQAEKKTAEGLIVTMPWGHVGAVVVLVAALAWAFWARSPDLQPEPQLEPKSRIETKQAQADSQVPTDRLNAPASDEPVKTRVEPKAELIESKIVVPREPQAIQGPEQAAIGVKTFTQIKAVKRPKEPSKPTPVRSPAEPSVNESADPVALDEQRLMGFSKNGYVLQLMASGQRAALMDYRALQRNANSLSVYRLARSDSILYVLVEGFYASKDAARAGIVNLPKIQQQDGPWPKSVAQVQSEILAAQALRIP